MHRVDRDMLNNVVRVDDKGRTVSDAFATVAYPQLVYERAGHIAELVVSELIQLGLFAAATR